MSEAEFSPGVAKEHVEAALGDPAMASLRLGGAPVVVISGASGRVVYANEPAQGFFAGDLAALGRRLLLGAEPGARRIVSLSRSLLPGAAPRLERLRFFFGPVADTVTVLCRRVTVAPGETLFALAVLGVRAPTPARRVGDAPQLKIASETDVPSAPVETPEATTLVAAPLAALAEPQAAPAPAHHVAQDAEPQDDDSDANEAPQPVAPPARGARFAWRTDGDHVVTFVSPALGAEIGAGNADIVGRSLIDIARDNALDADGRLVAALAARDTFAGIETLWPAGEGQRAQIALGAAPAFDEEDRFDGFRGYGVIRAERIAAPHSETPHSETPQAASEAAVREIDAIAAQDEAPPPLAILGEMPPTTANEEEAKAEATFFAPYTAEAVDHAVPARLSDADAATKSVDPQMIDLVDSDEAADEEMTDLTPTGLIADDAAPSAAGHEANDADEADEDEIVALSDAGEAIHRGDVGAEPASAHEHEPLDDEPLTLSDEELAELDVDDEDEIREHEGAPDPAPRAAGNIVPLRPEAPARPADPPPRSPAGELSPGEKSAFEEIGRALGAEPAAQEEDEPKLSPAATRRARDLIDLVARFGRSDEPKEEVRPVSAPLAAVSDETAPKIAATLPERNAAAVLERLPVGVVVSRFDIPIYANRTLLDLLDFADIDAFHEAGGLDRLFRGRSPDSGAAQIETREGEVLPVDARVQAVDWDGQPATLVTLRRAQQENGEAAKAKALELDLRQRDAEARELHAILDTATDGVAVLDSEGRILSLNRSGEALFGFDQNEVAGEPFSILVAKESHEAVSAYFEGVKSGGVQSVLNDGREIFARARQGGSIPVFVTLGRLGSGATPKFCAVLRDLTAWKKAERELGDARREAERASALKSDFLAKVSHEIRTPLNAILGFAEVIMDERFGPVGNARYRDYMRDIHKSGEHVLSLVNDLLDLSKIEAGKVDLTFTSVDINAVVAECVSIMQPQANRDRVVMRLSLAPNLPNIVADERSMRQIVLNLLSNAVKFNEPGGQAIVSTALTDAGHAVVRIKDTGVGMSDDEVETALEPFRQVSTARKGEGTGLGLPLTKALVEANRASFTIRSRKGEGTMVEVTFPPTRVLAE